jgi:hypothetical protein
MKSSGIHHTDCDVNVLFALWWLLLGRILEERNSVSCILFAHYWPGCDDSQMEQAECRLVMLPPDRSAEDKLKIPPQYAPTSTR